MGSSNLIANSTRIQTLPEDDMPDEILSIVCQSEDLALVDQESAGYVIKMQLFAHSVTVPTRIFHQLFDPSSQLWSYEWNGEKNG